MKPKTNIYLNVRNIHLYNLNHFFFLFSIRSYSFLILSLNMCLLRFWDIFFHIWFWKWFFASSREKSIFYSLWNCLNVYSRIYFYLSTKCLESEVSLNSEQTDVHREHRTVDHIDYAGDSLWFRFTVTTAHSVPK